MVEIERSHEYGALTESGLAEFERQLAAGLPDDYRAFLLQHNGGRPSPNLVEFVHDGQPNSSDVDYLYGLHKGPYATNLERVLKMFGGRIPTGFLPIGNDSGGNKYVLGLEAPHRGRVYFWDHEMEVDEGEVPTIENMSPVAESFSALLEGLFDDEDE